MLFPYFSLRRHACAGDSLWFYAGKGEIGRDFGLTNEELDPGTIRNSEVARNTSACGGAMQSNTAFTLVFKLASFDEKVDFSRTLALFVGGAFSRRGWERAPKFVLQNRILNFIYNIRFEWGKGTMKVDFFSTFLY